MIIILFVVCYGLMLWSETEAKWVVLLLSLVSRRYHHAPQEDSLTAVALLMAP